MPKGRHSWGRHLLGTAFAMAAGVLVAVQPAIAQGGPGDQHRSGNEKPVAAPTDLYAYRHPTLASNSTEDVEVQLVLAMDSSGSMAEDEWQIQLRATAAALMSSQVRTAIRCKSSKTGNRSIAIAVVDFADQPSLRIPWVDLRPKSCSEPDPEFDQKIETLAAQIATLPRRESGSTHIGNMLEYTVAVFANSPWNVTERRVLDISGDGKSNGGVPTEPGRQALMKFGVTINGIAIINEDADLDTYFLKEIVSNPVEVRPAEDGRSTSVRGQVWEVAKSLQANGNSAKVLYDFGSRLEMALTQKISMETTGIYDQQILDDAIRGTQMGAVFQQNAPGDLPWMPPMREQYVYSAVKANTSKPRISLVLK